jgi:hypothetical protein
MSKWIQKSVKKMKKKGTVGSFTAYCQRKGYSGVTAACIREGKASSDPAIRKKANWAANVRK